LEARKSTPTIAAKLRSLLGAAWEYALDSGRLKGDAPNWWRLIMKGRLKSQGKIMGGEHVGRQRRVFSQDEIGQLLDWLPNMHSLGRDMTVMYLWTCCRGSEIVSLKPEHIHREGKQWWWIVPLKLTKNANVVGAVDLRVPLFGKALEVVQRRVKNVGKTGLLFEDVRQEQYTQHDYSTYIYHLQPHSSKAKRRQGEGLVLPVSGWSPHDLRRTGRTALAQLGSPQEVAEAILGHMPTVLVGTYNVHTYDAERVVWLKKLSDWLDQAAASVPAPRLR
jgi:integrase